MMWLVKLLLVWLSLMVGLGWYYRDPSNPIDDKDPSTNPTDPSLPASLP